MSRSATRPFWGVCALLVAAAGARAETPGCAFPAGVVWAAADFDGNQTLDWASVDLGVGSARLGAPCASLPWGLGPQWTLTARDVDSDHDQDLILAAPFATQAHRLWLNDGAGEFTDTDLALFPGLASDPPRLAPHVVQSREPAVPVSLKSMASLIWPPGLHAAALRGSAALPIGCRQVPKSGRDLPRGRAPPPSF